MGTSMLSEVTVHAVACEAHAHRLELARDLSYIFDREVGLTELLSGVELVMARAVASKLASERRRRPRGRLRAARSARPGRRRSTSGTGRTSTPGSG